MELKWLEFDEVEKRAGTIVGEGERSQRPPGVREGWEGGLQRGSVPG